METQFLFATLGALIFWNAKPVGCPNPQTGEKVDVPAHWIPRFYPGNGMRRVVKLWEDNTKRGLI